MGFNIAPASPNNKSPSNAAKAKDPTIITRPNIDCQIVFQDFSIALGSAPADINPNPAKTICTKEYIPATTKINRNTLFKSAIKPAPGASLIVPVLMGFSIFPIPSIVLPLPPPPEFPPLFELQMHTPNAELGIQFASGQEAPQLLFKSEGHAA